MGFIFTPIGARQSRILWVRACRVWALVACWVAGGMGCVGRPLFPGWAVRLPGWVTPGRVRCG